MGINNLREIFWHCIERFDFLNVDKRKIKSWCRGISAFANIFGGSLVLGIFDDDEIVGVIGIKGDSELTRVYMLGCV